jgi:hypothetical protein
MVTSKEITIFVPSPVFYKKKCFSSLVIYSSGASGRFPGSPSVFHKLLKVSLTTYDHDILYTDKKEIKFSSFIRKFRGIGCKVIYDYNGLLIFGENNCAFPQILGSPSSYMYYFAPDPI